MDISKDIIDELIPCFQQPGYFAHIEREEIYSYKSGNWVKRKGQFNKWRVRKSTLMSKWSI
jgi:hypothetical protein